MTDWDDWCFCFFSHLSCQKKKKSKIKKICQRTKGITNHFLSSTALFRTLSGCSDCFLPAENEYFIWSQSWLSWFWKLQIWCISWFHLSLLELEMGVLVIQYFFSGVIYSQWGGLSVSPAPVKITQYWELWMVLWGEWRIISIPSYLFILSDLLAVKAKHCVVPSFFLALILQNFLT